MRKTTLFLFAMAVLAIASTGLFAQAHAGKQKAGAAVTPPAASVKVYVCDECDKVYDKPGKCTCGQALKAVNKSDIYYECDMCKVKSDKAGQCPKCGMDMRLHVASWEKAEAAEDKS